MRGIHSTALLDLGIPVHTVAQRIGDDPAILLRNYTKRKLLLRGASMRLLPPTRSNCILLPLKAKIRDPQARGVITHDALNILREAVCGLGVDIERQRHSGAADAVQLA